MYTTTTLLKKGKEDGNSNNLAIPIGHRHGHQWKEFPLFTRSACLRFCRTDCSSIYSSSVQPVKVILDLFVKANGKEIERDLIANQNHPGKLAKPSLLCETYIHPGYNTLLKNGVVCHIVTNSKPNIGLFTQGSWRGEKRI